MELLGDEGADKVLDVMATTVQKLIIKKNGELHKPYVTYTAVVASCDDHWRNLTKAEKEELLFWSEMVM